ncbi:hypothetical protein [Gymnodinialimonas hymeniacidonis]|uniref:hypothetical protein n=1 Tax=Gymnodinialimonas hymeniacidonis TaxID=3126508 RepID=UPI0034C67F18
MYAQPQRAESSFLITHLGGLTIAFAACLIASLALRLVGATDPATSAASLTIFVIFMFADPVGAWRGVRDWSTFRVRLGAGGIVALLLSTVFNLATEHSAGIVASVGREGFGGVSLTMILAMLIVPIVTFGPVIERILSGKGPNGERLTWDSFQIGLTFPLYVSLHFGLMGVIAVALWTLGVPWVAGVLTLTAGALVAVGDAWTAAPEDRLPSWQPKVAGLAEIETAETAWGAFRQAIRGAFPSALFLAGLTFTTVALAVSVGQATSGSADSLNGVFMHLASIAGVIVAVLMGLSAFAMALASAMASILAHRNGLDAAQSEQMIKESLGRLFVGGTAFVRPAATSAATSV